MATNLTKNDNPKVRQADVRPSLSYEEMSPLGRDLFDIAKEIEASDDPAMDEAAIERELARRRGGYAQEYEDPHLP
jgi:hypothetical protein